MKYSCCRLLIVILIILVLCFAGCVAVKPVPTWAAYSASPEQSGRPSESPAKGPADELALPGYDVKTSILWDLNGDGARETVSVGLGGEGESFGNDILLSVSDNGGFNTVTVGVGYFEAADYLVTPGGAFCVIVCCNYEDDYSSTAVVSFNGLNPVLHGSIDGTVTDVSGSGVTVSCWVNVFGTWPCVRYYAVTDDFSFKPSGDFYIDTTYIDPLITKSELPVEIWKGGDYVRVTIEEGTSIIPYSTDGETYMNFRIKDYFKPEEYAEGRICFTIEDYIYFIGGVSEYDCFEEVPYAG